MNTKFWSIGYFVSPLKKTYLWGPEVRYCGSYKVSAVVPTPRNVNILYHTVV